MQCSASIFALCLLTFRFFFTYFIHVCDCVRDCIVHCVNTLSSTLQRFIFLPRTFHSVSHLFIVPFLYLIWRSVHTNESGRGNFSNICDLMTDLIRQNGGNSDFGAKSTGCSSQTSSVNEEDSLKKVRSGGFYGYANRNRGRTDAKQCVHHGPRDGGNFIKPAATLEPSTDGLIEYTANTFGATMRSDLLATKLAVEGDGRTYRITLNDNGDVRSSFELTDHSGLTAAMTPTGGLIMPRVYQERVAMLLPVESNPNRLVVTSVTPFRGPRRGGNDVMVTGWNLRPPLTATFGSRACTNPRAFRSDGRAFWCTVPRGTGKVAVHVKKGSSYSRSFGFEYMYMAV